MDDPRPTLFRIFNEIGIIDQLATAALAQRLPDGVHPSQFALLGNLMRLGDGKTPAALAQAFQVPKASMTNTLLQLQKRKFIDVQAHTEDGRKKLVFLTDAGRALYVQTIAAMAPPIQQATEGLTGLEDILPILEDLRKRLDANRDP